MEGAAFVQPRQATHLQTFVSASSCPRPFGGVLLGGFSIGWALARPALAVAAFFASCLI